MKRGLLLIDRGSREREAAEELEIICETVNQNNEKFSCCRYTVGRRRQRKDC